MNGILIANILTVIGQLVVFYASTRHEKGEILRIQIVSMLLMSCASLILKGYSAIVMDAVGIARNVLSIYGITFKGLPYIFIVISIVFGALLNNMGFLGLFPIFANVAQSLIFLDKKATTRQIQLVCSFASVCWAVYNFAIASYAGTFFDAVNAVSYLYSALKEKEK